MQLHFRRPGPQELGDFMPVGYALQIIGAGITQKLNSVSLGRAFSELGFQKKTYRNVRGYIVVRRSAEEMRSMQRMMANEADTDTDDTDVF